MYHVGLFRPCATAADADMFYFTLCVRPFGKAPREYTPEITKAEKRNKRKIN
jgi:hypothetical protein